MMFMLPGCKCCGVAPCSLCTTGSLPDTVTMTPSGLTGCLAQFNGVAFVLQRTSGTPCVYSLNTTASSCTTLLISATFEYKGPTTKATAYFSARWWNPTSSAFNSSLAAGTYINATSSTDITDCSSISVTCTNNVSGGAGTLGVVGGGTYVGHTGVVYPDGCIDNVRVVVSWMGQVFKATSSGLSVPSCTAMQGSASSYAFTDCTTIRYPTAVVYWQDNSTDCPDGWRYNVYFDLQSYSTYSPCFKFLPNLVVGASNAGSGDAMSFVMSPDGDVPLGSDSIPYGSTPLQIDASGGTPGYDPPTLSFERVLP